MVNKINFIERDLTKEELESIWEGFKENEILHTQVHQTSDRIGFVAVDEDVVIGCSTGLAYKNGESYNGWFYLTDLYMDKNYRGQGHGKTILLKLEEKLTTLGITQIYTWTAGFEAPKFYMKLGYEQFAELENYYHGGYSRFGMRKTLKKN